MPENNKPIVEVPIATRTDERTQTTAKQETVDIAQEVRRIAQEEGRDQRDWLAGYTSLTNKVRNLYVSEINKLISPIENAITAYLNGLTFKITQEPDRIIRQCGNDFDGNFSKAKECKKQYTEFEEQLKKEKAIFPNLNLAKIREIKIKNKGDVIFLFGLLAVMIMVESLANMSLLGSALAGGLIESFIVAILVSVINVAGVGAGIGFLFFWLYKVKRNFLYSLSFIWFIGVIFLNLVVGRHREAFVIDIAEKEKLINAPNGDIVNGTLNLSVIDVTNVSFNFLIWSFESVLFFLLGIVLCLVGFYKGVSFYKPGENLKLDLDKLDTLKTNVQNEVEKISERHRKHTHELREEVGN